MKNALSMRLSRINGMLERQIGIDDFRAEIAPEISEYRRLLEKKSTSCPIYPDEDLHELLISPAHVIQVGNAFIENRIDKWELNYIADAIMLSSKVIFEDDRTEEAVLSLADLDYFSLIDRDYVAEIIKGLGKDEAGG
jgi:hypothetical protein